MREAVGVIKTAKPRFTGFVRLHIVIERKSLIKINILAHEPRVNHLSSLFQIYKALIFFVQYLIQFISVYKILSICTKNDGYCSRRRTKIGYHSFPLQSDSPSKYNRRGTF